MPFSLCDAYLDLTEAIHVILSHPYVGPDTAVKCGSFPPSYRPKEIEWADAKRAGWSCEQWRVERLKWREVECRAVACIVQDGQTRSVQVTRVYAAHTREAEIAFSYGNPLEFYADDHTIAALEQDMRGRVWIGRLMRSLTLILATE
ncbi:hypothetical protein BC828DRAFT_405672 [Blastocladiella britannica]|nr:hypothetical protein BC828DRAFT_405672 [Blastocladiella britannica]